MMKFLFFPLLVFLILIKTTLNLSPNHNSYEEAIMTLEKMNRHTLLTIESSDGDLIDCIDKRKQPSLDHPLLRNHKIQSVPKEWVAMKKQDLKSSSRKAFQIWQTNGTRCPKNTIPIRRMTVSDIMQGSSISKFGKEKYSFIHQLHTQNNMNAMTMLTAQGRVKGAKAHLNLWNPHVEGNEEESVSKISIIAGPNANFNAIESGWHVSPRHYGGARTTRFFIYQTNDADREGCYNLLCTAFVQTSQVIALGAAYSYISIYDGNQYGFFLEIIKHSDGHWWLNYDGQALGYWPHNLLTHLSNSASHVTWGGQVVNLQANNRASFTEMGSGQFANQGIGKASYFDDLRVAIDDTTLVPLHSHEYATLMTNENCYNITVHNTATTYFFYGGPGLGSLTCH